MKEHNGSIILFPYLQLDEPLNILGIQLKSAQKIDTEHKAIQTQIKQLQTLFYLDDENKIKNFCYALVDSDGESNKKHVIDKLDKLMTIFRYKYLTETELNIHYTHFDFFVFPGWESIPDAQKIARILAHVNGKNILYFFLKNDKPLRTYRPLIPHYPITIQNPLNDEFCVIFYLSILQPIEEKKYLKAIDWYNRSFINPLDTDYCNSILCMQTAFEALFKIKDDEKGIKAQVKTGICSIMNESEQLIRWIDQFWKLRNAIIHGDTDLPPFLYISPGGSQGHIHHLYISRRIFRECLSALLLLKKHIYINSKDIHNKLISNEVRIKEIINLINKSDNKLNSLYEDGILEKIQDLNPYDPTFILQDALRLGRLFLKIVKQELNANNPTETQLSTIINGILLFKGNHFKQLADLYWQAYNITPWHFINRYDDSMQNQIKIEMGMAYESFMELMYWVWFSHDLREEDETQNADFDEKNEQK